MLSKNCNLLSKDCIITVPSIEQDERRLPGEIANNSRCSSQSSGICSNGDICRICHCESTAEAPLITPCYCSGSLRYVHQSCLQQWIKSSNIRCCELCKFQFIMQTKIKPFNEWEYLEMSGLERKKLLCAMLFHIIAMTCVCWSLYVLVDRTLDEVQKGNLDWPFWTKLVVVGIGFMGGIVFMYIQCKAYFILCQRWKAYNRVIYVQNAPEKPSITHRRAASGGNGCLINDVQRELPTAALDCSPWKQSYVAGTGINSTCTVTNTNTTTTTTSCIDIKGVRNLHIFFNEENRIRFHKPDIIPPNNNNNNSNNSHHHYRHHHQSNKRSTIDNNNSSTVVNDQLNRRDSIRRTSRELDTLVCNNTSWHIEIGNDCYDDDSLSIDKPSTSNDNDNNNKNNNNGYSATVGISRPADLKSTRIIDNDNADGNVDSELSPDITMDNRPVEGTIIDTTSSNNNNSNNSAVNNKSSSVVTLQIKKAEIFIEFGQNNNNGNVAHSATVSNTSSSNSSSNNNNNIDDDFNNSDKITNKSRANSLSRGESAMIKKEADNNHQSRLVSDVTTTAEPNKDNASRANMADSEEEEEKRTDGNDKKGTIEEIVDDCCYSTVNELATTKLLEKNYSSVSLNNVQRKQDGYPLTDWNSNDNLLSIP